jgi:hypothetical protein
VTICFGSFTRLLILEDVPVETLEDVLALVDLLRCPVQVLTGEREVPTRLVHLHRAFAIVPAWQCSFNEDV